MAFETVYKIPDSLSKKKEKLTYLRKKDLENLAEQNLLYFLRHSDYDILEDYPCMGSSESKLRYSAVEGPFELAPKINKKEFISQKSSIEILELLVPKISMPLNLEEISLVKYETLRELYSNLDFLEKILPKKINSKRMMEIGKKVLKKLYNEFNLKQTSNDHYKASTRDCVLDFYLDSTSFSPYPLIGLEVFGRKDLPRQIIREIGLYEFGDEIPSWHKNTGIANSQRYGLAYNLKLEGKNISEIIKSKNVLL